MVGSEVNDGYWLALCCRRQHIVVISLIIQALGRLSCRSLHSKSEQLMFILQLDQFVVDVSCSGRKQQTTVQQQRE